MSPEMFQSMTAFASIRSKVNEALDEAHREGVTARNFYADEAIRASYALIAGVLIEMDEMGKAAFGEANYVAAVSCTSDDPANHQGDTCPVHEA